MTAYFSIMYTSTIYFENDLLCISKYVYVLISIFPSRMLLQKYIWIKSFENSRIDLMIILQFSSLWHHFFFHLTHFFLHYFWFSLKLRGFGENSTSKISKNTNQIIPNVVVLYMLKYSNLQSQKKIVLTFIVCTKIFDYCTSKYFCWLKLSLSFEPNKIPLAFNFVTS